jgi:hypothetical protein
MDSSGDDMRIEMEEASLPSRPQTSLEPSSLYATRIDSQGPVTLPQSFSALNERLEASTNFAWAQPQAIFTLETSLWFPTISVDGNIISPANTGAHNFSLFRQNNVSSQSQNALPVLDQPFDQQQPSQFVFQKRAPKAPTMSAKNWKPHKNRIRQLYVSEGKSIKKLHEIMNKELGITAT